MKLKRKKGFTLVELLVVIAIIGILAVVAVPALFKNINKAKVADLEADYNAIKSASLSYYADKNTVPTDLTNDLKEYMDSVPTKSSLGEGSYGIIEEKLAPDTKKSLFLSIGEKELACGKTESEEHSHNKDCYKTLKGITLTKDQLEKLVNDMGEDKVYISKGNTNKFNIITNAIINNDKEVKLYIGENCRIKLKLIDNTSM